MSNTQVNYDPKYFYEELNRLVNEPHEYNRLLARQILDINTQIHQWVDGIPFVFDPIRMKWISMGRLSHTASYYGQNQKSRYLKFGEVPSMGDQGHHVPRSALITGIWARSRNVDPWVLELRKNDSPITLASASISSFGSVMNLDVDLEEGDWIQLFANGTKIDHPIACVELTWRL